MLKHKGKIYKLIKYGDFENRDKKIPCDLCDIKNKDCDNMKENMLEVPCWGGILKLEVKRESFLSWIKRKWREKI